MRNSNSTTDTHNDTYTISVQPGVDRFAPSVTVPSRGASQQSDRSLISSMVNCIAVYGPRYKKIFEIIMSKLIRIIYVLEISFAIYFLCIFAESIYYIFMSITIVLILADGIYVIFMHNGKEHSWFSVSSFLYTSVMLATIWIMVFHKYELSEYKCEHLANESNVEMSNYLTVPAFTDLCSGLEVFESLFILTVVLARWAYPVKEKVSKLELSYLLLTYITNGADITELIGNIDNVEYDINNFGIIFAILVSYTLSVMQFSTVLIMKTKRFSQRRNIRQHLLHLLFGTEIWGLLFILFLQDVPFLVIRIVILVEFQIKSHNFYKFTFFVLKNFVLCIFELYRIFVILIVEFKDKSIPDDGLA